MRIKTVIWPPREGWARENLTALFVAALLGAIFIAMPLQAQGIIPAATVEITVGFDENPPMSFRNTPGDTPAGLAIDILNDVAARERWTITYVNEPWSDLLARLRNGSLDLLVGIGFTADRAAEFEFTDRSIVTNWGVVYTAGDMRLESPIELMGARVALVENDSHGKAFNGTFARMGMAAHEYNVLSVRTYAEALGAIDRGEADAAVIGRLFGVLHGDAYDAVATPFIFNPIGLRYAAPQGANIEILRALDSYLAEGKAGTNAAYDKAIAKWISRGADGAHPVSIWFYLGSGGLVAVGLGAAWYLRRSGLRLAKMLGQRKLGAIVDALGDAVVVVAPDGRARYINAAAKELFDRSAESMIGEDLGLPSAGQNLLEIEISRGEKTVEVELHAADIEWDNELCQLVSLRDISARKDTEWRLRQAQKMETVGQLTGGIAHDFNNILAVILGNLQLLQRRTGDVPGVGGFVHTAIEATQRGAALTRKLLAFSRRQALEETSINANDLIVGLDKLLGRTLGAGMVIRSNLHDGIWNIKADHTQLETALLNLAINARDAMPDGGTLTIETDNVTLDDHYREQYPYAAPGPHVMISVTDTGTGMPPDVQERIFEPFFTTKTEGKGTGLGLAMIYGFIKQSRGHINVYSEPGQGTCFRIYLPRHVGRPEAATAATAESDGAMPTGTETILLVEDRDEVRATACALLEDLGYTVIEASDGRRALDIAKSGQNFDVLLTDVIMPGGINGPELARRVRILKPRLPVLLASGFPKDQDRNAHGFPILAKPYEQAVLARALRQEIEKILEPAGVA